MSRADCENLGSCEPLARAGSISGHVINVSNGKPVPGVTVETEPATKVVETSSDGTFQFNVPLPETTMTYRVIGRHPELGSRMESVTLTEQRSNVELALLMGASPNPGTPPPSTPPENAPPELDLRVLALDGVQACAFEGEQMDFQVDLRNVTDSSRAAIVIYDSLPPQDAFARRLSLSDIRVDRERFPEAKVAIDPDGFSFRVGVGTLSPTADVEGGYVNVYSVSLPSAKTRGVWCNTAVGYDNTTRFADARVCAATTMALLLDVSNNDGQMLSDGGFDARKEIFNVGEGFVYRIEIGNRNCDTLMGSRVVAELDPVGIVRYEKALEGYPTRGIVTEIGQNRFVWEVGDLAHEESAILIIKAIAEKTGEAKSGVTFTSSSPSTRKIDEERTRVEP